MLGCVLQGRASGSTLATAASNESTAVVTPAPADSVWKRTNVFLRCWLTLCGGCCVRCDRAACLAQPATDRPLHHLQRPLLTRYGSGRMSCTWRCFTVLSTTSVRAHGACVHAATRTTQNCRYCESRLHQRVGRCACSRGLRAADSDGLARHGRAFDRRCWPSHAATSPQTQKRPRQEEESCSVRPKRGSRKAAVGSNRRKIRCVGALVSSVTKRRHVLLARQDNSRKFRQLREQISPGMKDATQRG